jgi:hypothetical protein
MRPIVNCSATGVQERSLQAAETLRQAKMAKWLSVSRWQSKASAA